MGTRIDYRKASFVTQAFDVTLLGEDISLIAIDKEKGFNYATLDNGRMEGLQSNFPEDSEEARIIRENCDKVRLALIEISKVINKELYDTIH